MTARVTLDALPGQVYWGTVEKIAPLPDASVSFFNPDLKVYPTQIRIKGEHPGLRTGMSCRAEIVVARLDDAVSVPVQSVVRVGGEPSVFVVRDDGSVERRVVEVGPDDNARQVITSGVAEGERVSLTPPLQDTGDRDAIGVDDLPEGAGAATAAATTPTTRPAADAEVEPVTVSGFREAMPVLMERLSEAEKKRFAELREAGDWQKMQNYGKAMMIKHKVTIAPEGGEAETEVEGEALPSTRPSGEAAGE